MRKVTTDKKSLANINNMVKQANIRLHELRQELNELNAHIVVNIDEITAASGRGLIVCEHLNCRCVSTSI